MPIFDIHSVDTLRRWLADEGEFLRGRGFAVKLRWVDGTGAALEAQSNRFAGAAAIWTTGEFDFEIMDMTTGEFVVDRAGLMVTEANHATVLREFAAALTKLPNVN